MSTLNRAIEIAVRAHSNQTDKGGEPYILHPMRVMLAVRTPEERIVAILHDVVEDSEITFQDLANEGFSAEIIDALEALTKHKGETRFEAAQRTVKNPIARAVKLADVTDNMNLARIPNPQPADFDRLKEYEVVLKILQG